MSVDLPRLILPNAAKENTRSPLSFFSIVPLSVATPSFIVKLCWASTVRVVLWSPYFLIVWRELVFDSCRGSGSPIFLRALSLWNDTAGDV